MAHDNGIVTERAHLTRSKEAKARSDETWQRIWGDKKVIDIEKPRRSMASNGESYYTNEYVNWLEQNLTETQLRAWNETD